MDLRTLIVWIFFLIGLSFGRHLRGMTGVGRVGEPVFSFDPFAGLLPSASSSSSSSASSGSSASSSSSSGRSRTASATSRRRPGRTLDPRRLTRRRAYLANIGGRTVLIVPSNRQGVTSPTMPQQAHLQPVRELSLSMRGLPGHSAVQAQIGLGTSRSFNTPARSHGPPGVQFLNNQRGGQTMWPQQRSAQLGGREPIYIHNGQMGRHIGGFAPASSAPVAPNVIGARTTQNRRVNAHIPNSNLRVTGITPKGELIITGPGGSITIGTDLLTGISRRNAFPLFTEFEEVELEGQTPVPPMNNSNPGPPRFELSQHGRGSIFIEGAGSGMNTQMPNRGLQTGSAEVASSSSAASSASSSAGGSSAASSSAASSAGGGAAASSSASAGGASASSSSSSSSSSLGHGITFEKGGQLIRLGENGGKTQTITMGGKNGQIQVADGGAGIQVPGNATFIVSG